MEGEKRWEVIAWIENEDGTLKKVEFFIITDYEEIYEEVWEQSHNEILKEHGQYYELQVWEID